MNATRANLARCAAHLRDMKKFAPGVSLVCPRTGKTLMSHAASGECPDGLLDGRPPDAVVDLTVGGRSRDGQFRSLWREIHTRKEWTPAWWSSVVRRLPCGGCKRETRTYTAVNPIPFGDDAACAAWAVTFHNAVNQRLGKPHFTPVSAPKESLS